MLSRLIAWSALYNDYETLARRAWKLLLEKDEFGVADPLIRPLEYKKITNPLGKESLIEWVRKNRKETHRTPHTSQWCLIFIECLELIGDYLDKEK